MFHRAIKIHARAPVCKAKKDEDAQSVLDKISEFLDEFAPELALLLIALWENQQKAITYAELKEAIQHGFFDEETLTAWEKDVENFAKGTMYQAWGNAMGTAACNITVTLGEPRISRIFTFDPMHENVINWIRSHGAEWVTEITHETRNAMAAMIQKAAMENWTSDELSRAIRPLIGLTERQAKANLRYYQNVKETLLKNNPRMREATAAKKAREAAEKYVKRQIRERAYLIANTELAYAYNRGAHEAIRQGMEQGLLGAMVKIWSTAADSGVCEICAALDGVEVDFDGEFDFKGKMLFAGQKELPPAHPRCRCAVEYREVDTA